MTSPPDTRTPGIGGNQSEGKSTNDAVSFSDNSHNSLAPEKQDCKPHSGDLGPYPYAPGSKGPDGTSQDAAKAIAGQVKALRTIALSAVATLGDATPLEAIAITGLTDRQLQPRFFELKEMGLLEAAGERRCNPSGKFAAVLTLTDNAKERLA